VPRPYPCLKQHQSIAAFFQAETCQPTSSIDLAPLQEEQEEEAAAGEEDQEGWGEGGKEGREGWVSAQQR